MSAENPAPAVNFAPPWWVRLGRELGRQSALLALWLGVLSLILVGLGMLAAALQAQRDEARAVDLALVMTEGVPADGLAERVFDLYRRGLMPHIVIVGAGREGLRAQLIERGMREEVLLVVSDERTGVTALQAAAQAAHTAEARSVLVIAPHESLLAGLKSAQDHGLRAYAAPLAERPGLISLVQASLTYWQYVLALQA